MFGPGFGGPVPKGRPETVPGDMIMTHQLEGLEQGVLGQLSLVVSPGEDTRAILCLLAPHFGENRPHPRCERDLVFALCLHTIRQDDPYLLVEIHFRPYRLVHFA